MTTWNPADRSANITLSNADLTSGVTSAVNGAVRSTNSQAAGKTYFEVTWNSSANGANDGCGLTTGSAALGSIGPSAIGAVVYSNTGNIYVNGGNASVSIGPIPSTTVCVAFDLVNSRIWFRKNAGNWNNSGTANPATNTGGLLISALFPTNAAFACAMFNATAPRATVNFGATAFGFTVPSGFARWDALFVPAVAQTAVTINV